MSANYQTFLHLFSDSYEKSCKTMNLSEFCGVINLSEKNYINVRDLGLFLFCPDWQENYKDVREQL